jgi:hypothetical protein
MRSAKEVSMPFKQMNTLTERRTIGQAGFSMAEQERKLGLLGLSYAVWIHIREQMKISIGHGRLNDLT